MSKLAHAHIILDDYLPVFYFMVGIYVRVDVPRYLDFQIEATKLLQDLLLTAIFVAVVDVDVVGFVEIGQR